jgi:hypothetical protein
MFVGDGVEFQGVESRWVLSALQTATYVAGPWQLHKPSKVLCSTAPELVEQLHAMEHNRQ